MPLTPIQVVKLEIGLNGLDEVLLTDAEIQYFIDKHFGNTRLASIDAAKTLLFILSRYVHEKSGPELELWGQQWFEQYLKALKLYISDPNFSVAIAMAQAYAGGISKQDVFNNISTVDNIVVSVQSTPPTDGEAVAYKDDPFDRANYVVGPFTI